MNRQNKRVAIMITIILLLVSGLILFKQLNRAGHPEVTPSNVTNTTDARKTDHTPRKKKPSPYTKYASKEEIRTDYGKIEIVNLYNGKTYEGAVLTTDEFYTIVTVDGTFKIPMNEVKLRTIIR